MRKIMGTIFALLIAFASVSSAAAQDTGSATVIIESDGVLVATILDATFGTVPYDFADQTASTDIVVNVEDNTGTAAGWNVTLFGTDFIRDGATTFPVSQLVLGTGTPVSTEGAGVDGVTAPGITAGSTSPGEKIASAELLAGMGVYTITYPSTLTVPGGTLVGQYQSTLTVTITTGP